MPNVLRRLKPGERVYHFRAVVSQIGRDTPNEAHLLASKLKHRIANAGRGPGGATVYADVNVEPIDPPRRTLEDIAG